MIAYQQQAIKEFNKGLSQYNDFTERFNRAWQLFIHRLSNTQIDTLRQFLKYGNNESYQNLINVLTSQQVQEFEGFRDQAGTLEKIRQSLERERELHGDYQRLIQDYARTHEALLRLDAQRSVQVNAALFGLSQSLQNFANTLERTATTNALLSSLRSIDSSLFDLRLR